MTTDELRTVAGGSLAATRALPAQVDGPDGGT